MRYSYRLNKRNLKLQKNFFNGKEYVSKKDNREVNIETAENGNVIISAKLHQNTIAKKILCLYNNEDEIYVSYAGWRTKTTSSAIKALIPTDWEYCSGSVIAPSGAKMSIPLYGFLKLVDPVKAHKESWISDI